MKIEILFAVMNCTNENEINKILEKNQITGQVLVANQATNTAFTENKEKIKVISYNEIGASQNRNRLLENATGDICAFADDDTIFEKDYEKIIEKEYKKRKDADIIVFFAENQNKSREKNKKIGNKKINKINLMKVRTYEITIKKQAIEKINKMNIKFDANFGPGNIFKKGEETVFISDLLDAGIKIYSVNKKIASSQNENSTWFTGFNDKFMYDQGAIFYRIYKKYYKIMILQYLIRKYHLYRKTLSIKQAYTQMQKGAQKCKEIYG